MACAARVPRMRPRAVFVGHTRYQLPLPRGLERKWDALEEHLEYVVVAAGEGTPHVDPRFELSHVGVRKIEGLVFHACLANRLRRIIGVFRPDAVVAQSAYEGLAALIALRFAKPRPKLVVEVHGDWRSAGRLYGSRIRGFFAPAAERLALHVLRSADGTRAVGSYTALLIEEATGRPPIAIFPTYTDIETFLDRPPRPLPLTPTAIWIGALERVKDPGLLERAWPLVADRLPRARLVIVGAGRLGPVAVRLCSALPHSVQWISKLTPTGVADLLDRGTVLAMTSQSEGSPRVIIEAFSRGRPVVAPAVGGIPDMVTDDRNGVLIPAGDAGALAQALLRVLRDREFAARLAAGALADARQFQWTPAGYARAVRQMVDSVVRQEDQLQATVKGQANRSRAEKRHR